MPMSPLSRSALRGIPAVLVVLLVAMMAAVPADAQGAGAPDPGDEGYLPNEVLTDYESGSTFAAEGDNTVHDITFPLPAGSYATLNDSYNDARGGGRVHRANDLMADRLVPVFAVVDGEIIFAPGTGGTSKPSYGYMLRLAGDDGMFYSYFHLNDDATDDCDRSGGPEVAYADGIEAGTRVERGQHVGWVGSSGNASCSGPHLHFEIGEDRQFQVRHNPMASLEAAEDRGDFPDSIAPIPGGTPATPGGTSSSFARLSGQDRIATAVALSQETRLSARAVVIVPAGSHVEALVAAPLAGEIDAPILLSGPDGLSDAVIAEIRRLRPLSAYVIGTPQQLSSGVEQDIAAAGVNARARLTAPDRYALSVLVAEELMSYGVAELDEVILALGDAEQQDRAWPDALSASPLAARNRIPILLTQGDVLSDPVSDFLTRQRPDKILVIGGTAAIGEQVADEAAQVSRAAVTRLAGATRYATSVAVARHAQREGLSGTEIWIATGLNYPDALAAGPAAALSRSPLVLVNGQDASGAPESAEWLSSNAESLLVVGGSAVITDAVASALAP
ncbi:hypothetical protein BH23ACT9_BH23ACT9_22270 [soil metagenome]